MKVLYIEGLANHIGPDSCIGVRKGAGQSLALASHGALADHLASARPDLPSLS